MSALPPKADIHRRERYVRFVPKADMSNFIRSPDQRVQLVLEEIRARLPLRF
jgi:hypothetical protein